MARVQCVEYFYYWMLFVCFILLRSHHFPFFLEFLLSIPFKNRILIGIWEDRICCDSKKILIAYEVTSRAAWFIWACIGRAVMALVNVCIGCTPAMYTSLLAGDCVAIYGNRWCVGDVQFYFLNHPAVCWFGWVTFITLYRRVSFVHVFDHGQVHLHKRVSRYSYRLTTTRLRIIQLHFLTSLLAQMRP